MILVVEDQPDLLSVLLSMIKAVGYEAVSAGSGEEGLLRCGELGASLRLLLVDLCLPGIDGCEMVARSRESHSAPVVFMSGGAPQPLLELALAKGDDFLSKPIALADLRRVLDRHLAN